MRSSTAEVPELVIATVCESHEAVDRYTMTTGGALLDPAVAAIVETLAVTEYDLVDSGDYEV